MTQNKFLLRWAPTALLLAAIALVLAVLVAGRQGANAASNPGADSHLASVEHLTLNEMADRAEKIFRGVVTDASPGTISAGGADLPVITYRLRVEHVLKGDFESKDGVAYAEITMLGDVKEEGAQGDLQRFSALPAPPMLTVGSDYLLLLTPQSAAGLTSPMGLGQGSFEIMALDKQEWAQNGYGNAGLADGPVPYQDLAAQIEQLIGE